MSSRTPNPTLITAALALALACAPTAKSPDSASSSSDNSAEEATDLDAEGEELDEGTDGSADTSSDKLASVQPDTDSDADERSLAVVGEVVKKNRQIVRDCYEAALKKDKDLKGSLTIHFVLDPEGNVMSAELNEERSDIKTPDVVSCAIDLIKSLKFPPSSRGMETVVNYPFDLQPN
jgi:hypothetical protein